MKRQLKRLTTPLLRFIFSQLVHILLLRQRVLHLLIPNRRLRPRNLVPLVVISQLALIPIAAQFEIDEAITIGAVGNIIIAALAMLPSIKQNLSDHRQ